MWKAFFFILVLTTKTKCELKEINFEEERRLGGKDGADSTYSLQYGASNAFNDDIHDYWSSSRKSIEPTLWFEFCQPRVVTSMIIRTKYDNYDGLLVYGGNEDCKLPKSFLVTNKTLEVGRYLTIPFTNIGKFKFYCLKFTNTISFVGITVIIFRQEKLEPCENVQILESIPLDYRYIKKTTLTAWLNGSESVKKLESKTVIKIQCEKPPQFIWFKFNHSALLRGFSFSIPETDKAYLITKYYLYGSNNPTCNIQEKNLIEFDDINKIRYSAIFKNSKSFLCYGFVFESVNGVCVNGIKDKENIHISNVTLWEAKRCSHLPISLSIRSWTCNDSIFIDSHCRPQCPPGMKPIVEEPLRCLADERWSHPPGQVRCVADHSGRDAAAIIGILFLCGICVAGVGLTVMFKRRRRPAFEEKGREDKLTHGTGVKSQDFKLLDATKKVTGFNNSHVTVTSSRCKSSPEKRPDFCLVSSDGFENKFLELNTTPLPDTTTVGASSKNSKKNRFKDIIPFDGNRVVLNRDVDFAADDDDDSDDEIRSYINASFVDGFDRPDAFIAAQGPKSNTVDDFWLMIWQQNVSTIVMLTNLVEGGKKKCEKYWPEVGRARELANGLSLKCLSESVYADFVRRLMELRSSVGGREARRNSGRKILQLHFTSWPDKDVPATPIKMTAFLRSFDRIRGADDRRRVVVHCSAGVGRTGTFLALHNLVRRTQAEGLPVEVLGEVRRLREKRMKMVQTPEQLQFLYEALKICLSKSLDPLEVRDLAHLNAKRLNDLVNNIRRLSPISNLPHRRVFSSPEHVSKLRFPSGPFPPESARVFVQTFIPPEGNTFVHAAFVDSYFEGHGLLVAQAPMTATLVDFLAVAWENRVSRIVCLNEIDEELDIPRYWPTRSQPTLWVGPFEASFKSSSRWEGDSGPTGEEEFETTGGAVEVHKFALKFSKEKDETVEIEVIQFKGWSDLDKTRIVKDSVPENFEAFARLLCSEAESQLPKTKLLVHCLDGSSKSGLFVACLLLLQKTREDGDVDFAWSVSSARAALPDAVDGAKQLQCLFSVVEFQQRDFANYDNFR